MKRRLSTFLSQKTRLPCVNNQALLYILHLVVFPQAALAVLSMTPSHPLLFSHSPILNSVSVNHHRRREICGGVCTCPLVWRLRRARTQQACGLGVVTKPFSPLCLDSVSPFHSYFSVIFRPPAYSSVAGVLSVDEIILGSNPKRALKV